MGTGRRALAYSAPFVDGTPVPSIRTASRKLRRPTITTLKLPLKGSGLSALHRHRPLKIRVRVVLVPPHKGEPHATASVKVAFKR